MTITHPYEAERLTREAERIEAETRARLALNDAMACVCSELLSRGAVVPAVREEVAA